MSLAQQSVELCCGRGRLLGEVVDGKSVGVALRPLDQLDSIVVWIGEPRGPEVLGTVRRAGGLSVESDVGEAGHSGAQVLDLDDEVVMPPGSTAPLKPR